MTGAELSAACKKEVSHDCLLFRAWGKIRDNRAKKARVFLTLVVALDTAHDSLHPKLIQSTGLSEIALRIVLMV